MPPSYLLRAWYLLIPAQHLIQPIVLNHTHHQSLDDRFVHRAWFYFGLRGPNIVSAKLFFAAFSMSKDCGVRCSVIEILEPLGTHLVKKILFLMSVLENLTRDIRLLGSFLLLMGCETEMQLRICSLVQFRSGRLVLIFSATYSLDALS